MRVADDVFADQNFRNRVPKIGNCNICGRPIIQGRPHYTLITIINMYLIIQTRYTTLKQYHGNFIEVEKLQLYA